MPVPTWADGEALLLGQADEGLSLGPDEEEVPGRQVLAIPQVEGEAPIQGPCGKHGAGHLWVWGGVGWGETRARGCSPLLTWHSVDQGAA